MKKCKKILLLLIIAIMMIATTGVSAKGEKTTTTKTPDYKKTCVTGNNSESVAVHYGITYEIGKTPGQFFLRATHGKFKIAAIEEGLYEGETNGFTPTSTYVTYLKGNVSNYVNNKNALIIAEDSTNKVKEHKVEVNAKPFKGYDSVPQGFDFVLRFTIVPAESDEFCQSPEDFAISKAAGKSSGTYTEYIYIVLRDFEANKPLTIPNTNYNLAACQTIRSAESGNPVNVNNSIDAISFGNIAKAGDANFYNKIAKYKSLVPFCFSPAGVVVNYDEKQVKTMVQTAIQSAYAIYLPQTVAKGQDWMASEQRACAAAGGTWSGAGQCSASGETWQTLAEGQEPTVNNGLYCKYEWKDLGKEDKSIGYKYTNINSYYAKTVTTTSEKYYYQYSEAQKNKAEDQNNTCTRVCEEVVDVEYGPPQAAIAGFCIEYQVKVTSHVRCTTNLDIHAPNPGILCVPTPQCVHKWGTITQAGPTEEFDACVQKCDGGKYSDTCSKKCYNEIYKTTSKTKKLTADDKALVMFTASSIDEVPTGGYYERRKASDGSYQIVWISTGDKKTTRTKPTYGYGTYADWYIINEYNRTIRDHGLGTATKTYFADGGGFKRQHFGDKGACNGDCAHVGCDDNTYVNAQRQKEDYEKNIAAYNTIVNKCAAQATCTEATATFTIEADVEGYPDPIKFPMNKEVDTLVSREQGERTENSIKEGSSLLSYNGCYTSSSQKDWYQAEWSFPGTWANNKTGEISYVDKGNDATWHQTKNKFCLPLTISNTNQKWWYYYMNQKSKHDTASNKGSYISQEYQKAHPEVINQNSVPKSSEIKWNIRAKTMKFGYFHWTFNINCFYATYAEDNGDTPTTNNPDNYTTRTIAKNNMFPSTKADDSTGIVKSSETGRTQGFNWTSAATIPDTKNPSYGVNPEALITKIQALGEKVYDEDLENEYLEYEFRLSPDSLKEIKRNNKSTNNGSGNYTNYDTNSFRYDEKKKVYIYTSPLIRGKSYTVKSPDENLLGCNNISKNKCETNMGGND